MARRVDRPRRVPTEPPATMAGPVSRTLTAYICSSCGFESPRWLGRCTACGEWNTLVEAIRERSRSQSRPPRAAIVQLRPVVCVIDSVQTLSSADLASSPGSVAQVREAADRLLRIAKGHGITIVLVGHVTKEGVVAGPRVLEHLVDAVLQLEGDRYRFLRVLRAVKNRFGSTNEIGIFEMTDRGLVPVADPSAAFTEGAETGPGSVLLPAIEGTRPILVEVQSLVADSDLAMP